jgi:hypothetical protein
MLVFAIGVENSLDAAVQRSHDANACKHRRAVKLHHKQQTFHCRSPFGRFVLSLRKLGDVVASVLQRDELATPGQRYRIFKRTFPAPAANDARPFCRIRF